MRLSLKLSAIACYATGFPLMANAASPSYSAPAGLAAGTPYRLIFITTDGITGSSPLESTYNSFANTEAATGQISGLPQATWSAVTSAGSTNEGSVTAAANIDCGTACDSDPIYLVTGAEVATSTAGLFGTLLNPIDITQAGVLQTATDQYSDMYAWTGSIQGYAEEPLGNTQNVATVGDFSTTSDAIQYSDSNESNSLPIYAISSELVVPATPVPEPASGAMLLVGGIGAALARRRRKGRPQD